MPIAKPTTLAEDSPSQPGANLWVSAVGPCTSTVKCARPVEVTIDATHGNRGQADNTRWAESHAP